ncbi:FxsA family protein [Radiobacillus sp. PE A8.2]|uniref:FxsA family protein n=1 Tax=Radiobacillus sp. PE A8.2 TaxID=3380349 RepID=UPI0038906E4D
MFRWIFLLILIVPALEIGVFLYIGGIIGPWWVVLLIIFTGVIGAWLARQQGMQALYNARQSINIGQRPQDEIFNGICILIGAILLLTPGFITDAVGFILLIPTTRRLIILWMQDIVRKWLEKGTITIFRR